MASATSATEFLDFLKHVDARFPNGLDIHIIMDNYAAHKTAVIKRYLGPAPALTRPYHTNIGMWIN